MTKAARFLLEAQVSQQVVESMPEALKPATLAEAYTLQAAVQRLRSKPEVGVKLGLGSANGMLRTGENGPLIGRIVPSRLHRSGVDVHIPAGATAVAEVEIAFEIGADGRSPAAAFLAFEIVASRLAGGPAQGLPAFTADDAGCHAVVLGNAMALDALDLESITLEADGAMVGRLAKGQDGIDPFQLFNAFLMSADRCGVAVRPGMIVMTGSQTVPYPVDRSMRLRARAGAASVDVKLIRG